jgi:tripartite-type tricarboxylate transporter receptor subunit TctC
MQSPKPAEANTFFIFSDTGPTVMALIMTEFPMISPVASLVSVPLFMMVHPSFPARSVPEFIAYAKANPGKINFGSSVLGSMLRMAGEMFKMMAGVDMTIVPYRG